MKKLSRVFTVLALLLSHFMCVDVTYGYCYLRWAPTLNSAPAWVALLTLIPYSLGVAVCLILAWVFRKKAAAE